MFAMHMLCKTGTVSLRVADPHFIFDRIVVRTILTHMCCILLVDLALVLKQVFSFYPITFLPPLLSGGHMYRNYTSGITIDPDKQGVVIIKVFFVRVKNVPPPPLCNPHHEPIVCVIYHLFRNIIVEISLGIRRSSDDLLCELDIEHIHSKNR